MDNKLDMGRGVGRPAGPPTKTSIFRLPVDLLDRLARYVDSEDRWPSGVSVTRTTVVVEAVEEYLAARGF